VFVSVLVRRLRAGKTYEDFVAAWYPERGFGMPARVATARNVADEREILTFGMHDVDLTLDELAAALGRVAAQESDRHDRIDAVVESTSVREIFEVLDRFDFTTDESVARSRPDRLSS
jgi:hypothetical protein